jgi:hypothetical protein
MRREGGREVAAVRGVLASVLGMMKGGATHVAVATDYVIESFLNRLWPSHKTAEGIEPDVLENGHGSLSLMKSCSVECFHTKNARLYSKAFSRF